MNECRRFTPRHQFLTTILEYVIIYKGIKMFETIQLNNFVRFDWKSNLNELTKFSYCFRNINFKTAKC